ncbi:methyltransferase domain-containing protein [Paenibacillus sp. RC67]|uniref:putative RNA methyltransferase n=1 Tax=Paenibacillus sp. RC67 TaxID=3039392 RepID=UPI0024ACCD76|nr:methyltransferase domain-containing protein [Paenibacillus sp. RC67]
MMSADVIAQYMEVFRCPICFGQMRMVHLQSLICTNQHCFDVSKQGYVNLLSRAFKTKYDKRMFESRRTICRSGFFEPLNALISDTIIHRLRTNERTKVLDTGCGEGSLLTNIQEKINQNKTNPLLAVGIDISKEGISSAAAEYSNAIWCVADMANCPFADHQFNIILNILSPANYSEFQRMIAHDGLVIKVIPERDYLKELRDIYYEGSPKQFYSNDNTLDHFKENFELTDVESVRYQVTLDDTLIEPLLRMTPLSWGTTEERLHKVQEMNLQQITIDLTILYGKK